MRTTITIASILLLVACGSDEPTAPAPTDVVDAAVAPDAGTSDVPEDVEATDTDDGDVIAEDVPVPVEIEDTAEDVGPPEEDVPEEDVDEPEVNLPPAISAGAMFRVNWVQVLKPSFFLANPQTGEVVDISAAINAYLGSHLTTTEEPMDIVGLFEPFDFAAGVEVTMGFGRGQCPRDADGNILWCDFYDEATFFEDTLMQPPGTCTAFSGNDACYTTTESDMSLDLAGVPLGFKEAFTAGKFVLEDSGDPTGLTKAFVQGFMNQETAQATTIYVPGFGDLVLSDLLDEDELIEKDGELGWFFEVNYKAVRVPKL